jgi:hypothetical protein
VLPPGRWAVQPPHPPPVTPSPPPHVRRTSNLRAAVAVAADPCLPRHPPWALSSWYDRRHGDSSTRINTDGLGEDDRLGGNTHDPTVSPLLSPCRAVAGTPRPRRSSAVIRLGPFRPGTADDTAIPRHGSTRMDTDGLGEDDRLGGNTHDPTVSPLLSPCRAVAGTPRPRRSSAVIRRDPCLPAGRVAGLPSRAFRRCPQPSSPLLSALVRVNPCLPAGRVAGLPDLPCPAPLPFPLASAVIRRDLCRSVAHPRRVGRRDTGPHPDVSSAPSHR